MSVLKKVSDKPVSVGVGGKDGKKDEWAMDYPGLWEHLTAGQYPDKTPRETSTLTLFTEEGRVKCCLSDRDQGRVAFLSGLSVVGLLEALEAHLVAGTLDWRGQKAKARK